MTRGYFVEAAPNDHTVTVSLYRRKIKDKWFKIQLGVTIVGTPSPSVLFYVCLWTTLVIQHKAVLSLLELAHAFGAKYARR